MEEVEVLNSKCLNGLIKGGNYFLNYSNGRLGNRRKEKRLITVGCESSNLEILKMLIVYR